ncbi:MAG: serine hydrolase [Cyclobacteriaceae bacterium]
MKTIVAILILSIISVHVVTAQPPITPAEGQEYFPPPDSMGGWRTLTDAEDIKKIAGMDKSKLDDAFDFIRTTTKNGGLLVLRYGYLVYENYFGKGQRDATPNLGSCGKSFTSIATGILMNEHPDLFPDGLDQKIFTPVYMPPMAFPLADPRMSDIKLGQLLSFSAGIRGNNPVYVDGKPSTIDPIGPDGWYALVDEYALGREEGDMNGKPFSTKTLWCEPGGGYSYATASIHNASIMLRHVTGIEMEDYVRTKVADPLGWGRWSFAYNYAQRVTHTPGGGGIALRSTDMLRFCYMLLHEGKWESKQIVPKKYIEHASKESPYNPHFPYSLQFNVNSGKKVKSLPRDAYWKSGSGGHCLYVVPSMGLIVWKLGGRDGQYDVRDTGLPEPEPLPNSIPPVNDGKKHLDHDDYITTLELVIRSVVEEQFEGEKTGSALPGQIIQDAHHPNKLVYNKDDNRDGQLDPFFLCGPGDPEGFLYRGRRNDDGTRSGDQLKLIQKLKDHGGNSIYFIAVRSHGGDAWKDKKDKPQTYPDDLHNPWMNQNPADGLNDKILDQWEQWFNEMDQSGIVIYFFIYDDAIKVAKQFGWSLDAEGNLHPEEKQFIQALISRFKHHRNLIWCTMEEGQEIGENWQQHISKIAEAIAEADPYNHAIASHQLSGNIFYHKNDTVISQFAIQTDRDEIRTADSLHQWMVTARDHSKGSYSLVMAEDWVHGNISCPNGNRDEIRQRNWAAAMADAYLMVFGITIDQTPSSWLNDLRVMQHFFESTTFNQMSPHDALAFGETNYILSNEGYDYILYASEVKENLGLKDLTQGTYSFTWMDCVDGKRKVTKDMNLTKGDHTWKKPSGFGNEVVLYIQRQDKRPEIRKTQLVKKKNLDNVQLTNIAPVVENHTIKVAKNTRQDIQLRFLDADGGPGPYEIEIISEPKHGSLSGVGNDKIFTPDHGYRGEDQFSWRVNDGEADSNAATIKLIVK